uniref:Uncharacterized protein n=1 Tax=Arundo donax TaxID=35708 RepID=A0A0A9BDT0_ARUDO
MVWWLARRREGAARRRRPTPASADGPCPELEASGGLIHENVFHLLVLREARFLGLWCTAGFFFLAPKKTRFRSMRLLKRKEIREIITGQKRLKVERTCISFAWNLQEASKILGKKRQGW